MTVVITHLQVDSLWSYLAAILLPGLDALVPVLPGDTVIIGLGVATAGSTDPRLALLVACAALGAFTGDNLSYWLGSRFEPFVKRRYFDRGKGQTQRAWAERSLARLGMPLIVVSRFVPGGRTVATLTCGVTSYDRRRFVAATAMAGIAWALYAFFAGRLGGRAFEDRPLVGMLVASAASLAVTSLIGLVRHLATRHGQR